VETEPGRLGELPGTQRQTMVIPRSRLEAGSLSRLLQGHTLVLQFPLMCVTSKMSLTHLKMENAPKENGQCLPFETKPVKEDTFSGSAFKLLKTTSVDLGAPASWLLGSCFSFWGGVPPSLSSPQHYSVPSCILKICYVFLFY
jgi:hypothetical protein